MQMRIWLVKHYQRWGKPVDVRKNLKRLEHARPCQLQRDFLPSYTNGHVDEFCCCLSKVNIYFDVREDLPDVVDEGIPRSRFSQSEQNIAQNEICIPPCQR